VIQRNYERARIGWTRETVAAVCPYAALAGTPTRPDPAGPWRLGWLHCATGSYGTLLSYWCWSEQCQRCYSRRCQSPCHDSARGPRIS